MLENMPRFFAAVVASCRSFMMLKIALAADSMLIALHQAGAASPAALIAM